MVFTQIHISFLIRWAYRFKFGRQVIKTILFPLFKLGYVQLGNRLYFKSKEKVPREVAWNIFSDQILTPIAHFFTRQEIVDFAEKSGLTMKKERLSINKQGLMFVFEK
ncbi:MAG: hypothetical protein ACE5DX_02675 [Candidatus Dojkabacteria bacterium]